jgi:hypothetical protein
MNDGQELVIVRIRDTPAPFLTRNGLPGTFFFEQAYQEHVCGICKVDTVHGQD